MKARKLAFAWGFYLPVKCQTCKHVSLVLRAVSFPLTKKENEKW